MGKKILITRPEAQARDFIDRMLKDADVCMRRNDFVITPMLEIHYLPFIGPDLDVYVGMIVTSGNALVALKGHEIFQDQEAREQVFELPLYVVGGHTARMARECGFRRIMLVAATAEDLLSRLAVEGGGGRLVYWRGANVRHDFKALRNVDELIVYDARKVDFLPEDAQKALRGRDVQAVTFFSARTARNFVELVQANGLTYALGRIKALCISPSVLESVRAVWRGELYAAQTPDFEGMKALIMQECCDVNGADM